MNTRELFATEAPKKKSKITSGIVIVLGIFFMSGIVLFNNIDFSFPAKDVSVWINDN